MPKGISEWGKHWELPPPAPSQALGSLGCPSWGECQAWAAVPLLVCHLGEPQHLHRAAQSLLWGQLGAHGGANTSGVHRHLKK